MSTPTPVRGQAFQFSGQMVQFRALATDTSGAFSLFEIRIAPQRGVPRHREHYVDEAFFVLKGTFMVQIGEDQRHLSPGDIAFVPKLIPHLYLNSGAEEGRLLILTLPGGYYEHFFAEIGELVGDPEKPLPTNPPDREKISAVSQRYGIELLPPSP